VTKQPPLAGHHEVLNPIEPASDEIDLPSDAMSLDFLQAVYRDAGQPMATRIRCAVAALPFERPKLAVVATLDSFGSMMEEMMERRGMRTVIDAGSPKALGSE
jgi:hypothetical protein